MKRKIYDLSINLYVSVDLVAISALDFYELGTNDSLKTVAISGIGVSSQVAFIGKSFGYIREVAIAK